jgi:hypothetical protein
MSKGAASGYFQLFVRMRVVSSATSYFARDMFAPASGNFEAIMFLATTLIVQAIPSAMTLLLLSRLNRST